MAAALFGREPTPPRDVLVAAAGSTMNLAVATVAVLVLGATSRRRPHRRVFWWLMAALNGFRWAGYFLFSGVSGIGDWGDGRDGVFFNVGGWAAWRLLLAAGGGLLYWLISRLAVRTLAGVTGADEAGRRAAMRISPVAYVAIGVVALIIGLMNPVGIYILLASAVASSFGGPSGLLWAPRYMRKGTALDPPFALPRRWSGISAGLGLVLFEKLVLGPSIRFDPAPQGSLRSAQRAVAQPPSCIRTFGCESACCIRRRPFGG